MTDVSDEYLVGGFKYVVFLPLPGEMIQFDTLIYIFSNGLKPPTKFSKWLITMVSKYPN